MPMFGMDPMGNYTGLDWTDTEEELRRQEEERRRLEAEKPVKQTVTINPDGTQDVTIKGSASTLQNMVANKRAASAAPVAPQNVSALGIGAQSGRRYAADLNNPSGLGWNGQTWNAYATPEEGVRATENQIGRYLGGQGPLRGPATPENVVSTWVTGGRTPANQIQGGAYLDTVKQRLADAGIQLNPDGSIPNTPEARQALTGAIVQHETLPQHRERFAPFLGGARPAASGQGDGQSSNTQSLQEGDVAYNPQGVRFKVKDGKLVQDQQPGLQ